ncbi:citrate transporter [Pueribacillus theae]|uniref:Citrate transporter n=1 Tax=Pueribacillus theae TaxID=2171751 RepID=A0A2U1JT15_9BACI|nr:citrate:proton symporter [Pueribacillus theae]PWA08023.1 citrate transporter [Pueribacillus theae]
MLTTLGILMVVTFIILIMTKRVSTLVALITIPIIYALIGGFGSQISEMMMDGVTQVAPTAVMLTFAILYFGIMIDAGLFDPLVSFILKTVKGDPLKIVIGTAILIAFVALDGDGTSLIMIVVSAMLPLYRQLKMNPLILSGLIILGIGILNLVPWGGPTSRAVAALKVDMNQVFLPLIPVLLVGLLWFFFTAYVLGKKEQKRLGTIDLSQLDVIQSTPDEHAVALEKSLLKRPRLVWVNLIVTSILMVVLLTGMLPLPILFMIATTIALIFNYPRIKDQKTVISNHASNVLIVVSLIFAAGIFTGILSGTKMADAMATTFVSFVPDSLASYLTLAVAVLSGPFTFFLSNDAFYFGILPVLAKTGISYGIDPVEIARASLLGQPIHVLSPLLGAVYLLTGMVGVEFNDHLRFILKWACATSVVMILAALLFGVI